MNQTHILFLNHEELKSQLMGAAMQPFIKSLFDRLHVDRGGTLYNSFEEVSLRRPLAVYDICRYQQGDAVCVCQRTELLDYFFDTLLVKMADFGPKTDKIAIEYGEDWENVVKFEHW